MKKLAIAVAMLITAIGIAVWSGIIFKNEMAALSASLEGLLDISESCDDDTLAEETEKTIAVWNDASKALHALVMHDAMNEVEQSITALPELLRHGGREEFRTKCIEALSQIQNLVSAEQLSWENVLAIVYEL